MSFKVTRLGPPRIRRDTIIVGDVVFTADDLGGSGVIVEDEGTPLTTDATTLDFVGAGVTASGAGATKTITIPGGAGALDDLSDVVITSVAEDDTLRYVGGFWINDDRRWEAVTDGEDVFVWDGDDLVHEWKAY